MCIRDSIYTISLKSTAYYFQICHQLFFLRKSHLQSQDSQLVLNGQDKNDAQERYHNIHQLISFSSSPTNDLVGLNN